VGAVDLAMDATNPRILFATMWRVRRKPYELSSGGEGSSLWKSTDGGDTWKDISRNEGLPKGTLGIIGVTVSPANPNRVWTIIEAQEGGVFRSDDGGEKWVKMNDERKLRQRAWYYTRIYADPKNADQVYVLNVQFWRSKDGGKTYEDIDTPHGDHHDLWIDPNEPSRMIVGDDGGAQVSFSAGAEWSTYHTQPTAQFHLRRPAGQLHGAHLSSQRGRRHRRARLGRDRGRRERLDCARSQEQRYCLRRLVWRLSHARESQDQRGAQRERVAG
jgi:photosystem II stability/assembly factor-like uncharacterized protein